MIGLIINPNSRKNRQRKGRVARYEKLLGKRGRVIETPSVDAIIPALRRFADEGRRYWVADGGDGALHWMLNEAVRYFGAARAAEMAVYLPTGSGSVDFVARFLGLAGDPYEVVTRLVAAVIEGREPSLRDVPSLDITGTQTAYGDESVNFRKVGFGNAFAGYGANFYGPLYRGEGKHGPVEIARHIASAFGAAAGRSTFSGRLASLKPGFLREAEHDYLRPLRALVEVDGKALRGRDGLPVSEHTTLHCASLPLNLAGLLRVFPLARDGNMHIHAGFVSATEMVKVFPGLMTGKTVNHLLSSGYDGPCKTLDVTCVPGEEMTPVIDGEVFHRVTALHAKMGQTFRMCSP
ncbi:MAG: hypothetical protein JNK72_21570 [Myxococcales bacterium]|nr:hypothetical protein [Myxococcales bacterium]